ncbi:MAG: transposase, partial [Gordonibacter sp.]
ITVPNLVESRYHSGVLCSQTTFSDIEHESRKRTTKRDELLRHMNTAIPWDHHANLVKPYYFEGKRGRHPIGIEKMLRVCFLQLWFNLSDDGVEDAIYDPRAFSEFMGVSFGLGNQVPDATTLLKFRCIIESHGLGREMLGCVSAILESKGATAANVSYVVVAHALVCDDDTFCYADSGYAGIEKSSEITSDGHFSSMQRVAARRPSCVSGVDAQASWEKRIESCKASVRAKAEHPFLMVKRQFGWTKIRYRGLAKNGNLLCALFALANIAIWARAGCPERPAMSPT